MYIPLPLCCLFGNILANWPLKTPGTLSIAKHFSQKKIYQLYLQNGTLNPGRDQKIHEKSSWLTFKFPSHSIFYRGWGVPYIYQLVDSFLNRFTVTPQKNLTAKAPEKWWEWKTILSFFFKMVYFQGRTVKLLGVLCLPKMLAWGWETLSKKAPPIFVLFWGARILFGKFIHHDVFFAGRLVESCNFAWCYTH